MSRFILKRLWQAFIAALGAEGRTEVLDLSHIDRGYADFRGKLKRLGAEIRRVRV